MQQNHCRCVGHCDLLCSATSACLMLSLEHGQEMLCFEVDGLAHYAALCVGIQHAALSLMKELLFVLDLAQQAGNSSDCTAADRLQRRCAAGHACLYSMFCQWPQACHSSHLSMESICHLSHASATCMVPYTGPFLTAATFWSLFDLDRHGLCRLLQDDQKESGLLPVLGRLVKAFSHRHQPRSHAGDLVESIHVVLRLLDRLCRAGAASCLAVPPCLSVAHVDFQAHDWPRQTVFRTLRKYCTQYGASLALQLKQMHACLLREVKPVAHTCRGHLTCSSRMQAGNVKCQHSYEMC